MYCKNCGKKNDELSKFCRYCGNNIDANKKSFATKLCPFCKTKINVDDIECPSCKRVLIEKIPSNDKNKFSADIPKSNHQTKKNVIPKIVGFIKGIRLPRFVFKKGFWILLGVILFVWILSGDDSSYNNSGTKIPLPAPIQQTSNNPSNLDLSAFDVSLTNGTILKKNSIYLRGDGELQIKNGTSLDAVAKLIRAGSSVLTVYIKANNTYTMTNISDGIYWLVFAQGSGWDSTTQRFQRNTQYSAFEDTFDFYTSNTQYTIFEITLNPVVGGTAETNSVDPTQFNAY